MQGIVVAGTHSGCGKTTVTLGLLEALRERGLRVQQFKAGPDFIDSGLHRLITGRPSRNLDLWMCGESYVLESFYLNSLDADISVVEGVMGLYDGALGTATLAATLGLPVILVVDAYGMAESAGAVVKGFMSFGMPQGSDSKCRAINDMPTSRHSGTNNIVGIIFNRVASENHFRRLKNGVTDVPVIGCLPRDLDFEIPRRHLGLAVAEENPISDENLRKLSDAVLECVDLDFIIRNSEIGLPGRHGEGRQSRSSATAESLVAVAHDRAFCFYYEDNLDLLKKEGAVIVRFSPLSDSKIPENADAVYIGGGYPELYARELSKNRSMLRSVYDWAHTDKPLYAECGGLMYLSRGIYDFDRNFYPMADIYPFETEMKKRRSKLGYREISLNEDCLLGKKGERLRGHEFHYSEITTRPSAKGDDRRFSEVYSVKDGSGLGKGNEGYRFRNTLASYIHVHFGSNPALAGNLVRFAKEREWKM